MAMERMTSASDLIRRSVLPQEKLRYIYAFKREPKMKTWQFEDQTGLRSLKGIFS